MKLLTQENTEPCFPHQGTAMRTKDLEIKKTFEHMLEAPDAGQRLQAYFAELPEKNIRRAISILSGMYPVTRTCSDDDFSFILYMFTTVQCMKQKSFPFFVSAINIIDFTEPQKTLLRGALQNHMELLCSQCTFELGTLLGRLFAPNELFQYVEALAAHGNRSMLHQAHDILHYEDFSQSTVAQNTKERLKQKILERLKG